MVPVDKEMNKWGDMKLTGNENERIKWLKVKGKMEKTLIIIKVVENPTIYLIDRSRGKT